MLKRTSELAIAQLQYSFTVHLFLPPAIVAYKAEVEGFASGSLNTDQSRALMIQLADQYPMTTIMIDVLDECDPEKRAYLLKFLELIFQESEGLVKIFVSSRDDQDVVWHLQDYPNLELSSDQNKEDIKPFVKKETESFVLNGDLLRLSINKENKEKLVMEIINRVTQGVVGM